MQRFEVTMVSLPYLISHVIAMNALCIVDLFALQVSTRCDRLVVFTANPFL